jgi:hydrogenase maturation protein HypF
MLRRSRGFVPTPIRVPWEFTRPVLACGAELKNTFCLGRGKDALLSHHIGDLENYETLTSFTTGIEHLKRLFDVAPEVVAYDLHPDYLSTKYALELVDVELVGVQHHHAHIASCLADNAVDGPVIGVAFDGTGFGADGTVWGGEFLVADLVDAVRVGRLAPVPLPGGAAAFDGQPPPVDVADRHQTWGAVRAATAAGLNSPLTSSAGRLFDAIACLLGVRDVASYEGQAAIELEQFADAATLDGYDVGATADELITIRGADLVHAVLTDLTAGVAPAVIAARFHNAVAAMIVSTCRTIRDRHDLRTVALSGGVFQNMLLVDRCVNVLEANGFSVLTHRQVPPNDGGISLGQAVIAAARGRAG